MKSVTQLLRNYLAFSPFATAMVLFALTGLASNASPALAENLPPPIFTRNVSFGIPYTIPPAQNPADQPLEVRLFVATQNSKGWQIADSKKLESTTQGLRGQFVYQAPADGEYWFAIRTVDQKGQLRGGKNGPELRVIVDTQPPTIRLNAERNTSGAITLRWELADTALIPDTLVMSYQVSGKPEWRTVAIDKGRAINTSRPVVGTATFWPDATTGDLQIRAEVRDRAGNNGMNQIRLEGKSGALTNNPPSTLNASSTTINPAQSTSKSDTANLPASSSSVAAATDPPPQFPFAIPSLNSNPTPNSQKATDRFGQPAINAVIAPTNESDTAQSVLRPTNGATTRQGSATSTPPPAQALNGMRLAPADDGPNLFAPLNSVPATIGSNVNPGSNNRLDNSSSASPPSPANTDLLPPAGSGSGNGFNSSGSSSLAQQGFPPPGVNSLPPQQPLTPNTLSSPLSLNRHDAALAPRVESRVVAPNSQQLSKATPDTKLTKLIDYRLPSGKLPTMVNSRTFDWEYEIDPMPSSGIAMVELWITQDGGKSWQSAGIDDDKRSPIRTQVSGEGVYGYRMTVQGNGASKPSPPQSGDQPDMWIGVDLTKPSAKLVNAELAPTGKMSGHIGITWIADDILLASKPIRLLFSDNPNGQWIQIAEGLENSGRYTWHYDEKTPERVYIRLEVSDIAGNIGVSESLEPIELGRYQAEGKLRGVKPIGERSSLIIPLDRTMNVLLQRPQAISQQTVLSLNDLQKAPYESPVSNQLFTPTEVLFENGNIKMIGNPYLSKKSPNQSQSSYR